jgi:hypothetical protein
VFRNSDERGYRDTMEWIASMYRPRPDYAIEYPLPESSTDADPGDARDSGP